MGLFSRRVVDTIPGRAKLLPGSFPNAGSSDPEHGGNVNSFSPGARTSQTVVLELVSLQDGSSFPGGAETVKWRTPNWVRMVLNGIDDGSGRWSQVPDPSTLDVPVKVDVTTRLIVEVDDELAAQELAPYREAATDAWKETEGGFAWLHQAARLPGQLAPEVREIGSAWREGLKELRDELAAPAHKPGDAFEPVPDKVREKRFAEADAQGAVMAAMPSQLQMMRGTVFSQFQRQAGSVAAGAFSPYQFELEIEVQRRTGVLTLDDVAVLRTAAGLGAGEPEPA